MGQVDIDIRAFFEGVRIPISSISRQQATGAPTTATITMNPTPVGATILAGTYVHVFCTRHKPDGFEQEYVMVFEGVVTGRSVIMNAAGQRQLAISCESIEARFNRVSLGLENGTEIDFPRPRLMQFFYGHAAMEYAGPGPIHQKVANYKAFTALMGGYVSDLDTYMNFSSQFIRSMNEENGPVRALIELMIGMAMTAPLMRQFYNYTRFFKRVIYFENSIMTEYLKQDQFIKTMKRQIQALPYGTTLQAVVARFLDQTFHHQISIASPFFNAAILEKADSFQLTPQQPTEAVEENAQEEDAPSTTTQESSELTWDLNKEKNKLNRARILVNTPQVRAALDAIAWVEAPDRKPLNEDHEIHYRARVGGKELINLNSPHPSDVVGSTNSSAAGRYQFIKDTWNGAWVNMGIKTPVPMTPIAQDLAAAYLLDDEHAAAFLVNVSCEGTAQDRANLDEALDRIALQWEGVGDSRGRIRVHGSDRKGNFGKPAILQRDEFHRIFFARCKQYAGGAELKVGGRTDWRGKVLEGVGTTEDLTKYILENKAARWNENAFTNRPELAESGLMPSVVIKPFLHFAPPPMCNVIMGETLTSFNVNDGFYNAPTRMMVLADTMLSAFEKPGNFLTAFATHAYVAPAHLGNIDSQLRKETKMHDIKRDDEGFAKTWEQMFVQNLKDSPTEDDVDHLASHKYYYYQNEWGRNNPYLVSLYLGKMVSGAGKGLLNTATFEETLRGVAPVIGKFHFTVDSDDESAIDIYARYNYSLMSRQGRAASFSMSLNLNLAPGFPIAVYDESFGWVTGEVVSINDVIDASGTATTSVQVGNVHWHADNRNPHWNRIHSDNMSEFSDLDENNNYKSSKVFDADYNPDTVGTRVYEEVLGTDSTIDFAKTKDSDTKTITQSLEVIRDQYMVEKNKTEWMRRITYRPIVREQELFKHVLKAPPTAEADPENQDGLYEEYGKSFYSWEIPPIDRNFIYERRHWALAYRDDLNFRRHTVDSTQKWTDRDSFEEASKWIERYEGISATVEAFELLSQTPVEDLPQYGESAGLFKIDGPPEGFPMQIPFSEDIIGRNLSSTRTPGYSNKGVDILAPSGTSVWSSAPGHVDRVGEHPNGMGYYIVVKHQGIDGTIWETQYSHLEELPAFEKFDVIDQGQQIGKVGNSGNADGYRLHYEMRKWVSGTGWVPEDPISIWRNDG